MTPEEKEKLINEREIIMSKFKVGDTVKVLSHKNKEMIGKVSTITEVLKDSKGVYLYKVKGIKNYATEKDIERE